MLIIGLGTVGFKKPSPNAVVQHHSADTLDTVCPVTDVLILMYYSFFSELDEISFAVDFKFLLE